MPFWRDFGTLTDTQLIVELGRTKNNSHLSILGLKISIKHSYTFLQNCVACFHCHILLWSPYLIGQTIVFLPCDFYLSFFLSIFFSSPNLSDRRLDVYHATWCGLSANLEACLKCASRGSLEIPDAEIRHFGTIAQLCRLYIRN